ncbi:OSGIN1, partial [Symbiodinium sp. CCMP2456]
ACWHSPHFKRFQDNEVFYERRDYHCCSETYGPRGMEACWLPPHVTFERCCRAEFAQIFGSKEAASIVEASPVTRHTELLVVGGGPAAMIMALLLLCEPVLNSMESHPSKLLSFSGNGPVFVPGLGRLASVLQDSHYGMQKTVDALNVMRSDHRTDCHNVVEGSYLDFRPRREPIPHVIVSASGWGGHWTKMPAETLALTTFADVSLPGFTIFQFLKLRQRKAMPCERPSRGLVEEYYRAYADHYNLSAYLQPGVVKEVELGDDGRYLVSAKLKTGGSLRFSSSAVVLANGRFGSPRLLPTLPAERGSNVGPLLVIGGGLSAADAVLAGLRSGRQVHHIFHRGQIIRNYGDRAEQYPEYHALRELMSGSNDKKALQAAVGSAVSSQVSYTPYMQASLIEFQQNPEPSNFTCQIEFENSVRRVVEVSQLKVLIGWLPDLQFMKSPSVSVELQCQATCHYMLPVDSRSGFSISENLHGIGSLAGTSFVRDLVSHAFSVLSSMHGKGLLSAGPRLRLSTSQAQADGIRRFAAVTWAARLVANLATRKATPPCPPAEAHILNLHMAAFLVWSAESRVLQPVVSAGPPAGSTVLLLGPCEAAEVLSRMYQVNVTRVHEEPLASSEMYGVVTQALQSFPGEVFDGAFFYWPAGVPEPADPEINAQSGLSQLCHALETTTRHFVWIGGLSAEAASKISSCADTLMMQHRIAKNSELLEGEEEATRNAGSDVSVFFFRRSTAGLEGSAQMQ